MAEAPVAATPTIAYQPVHPYDLWIESLGVPIFRGYYIEDLRTDQRPYLEGRAVGCVAAAQGWQAAVTTLTALRSIVHALRGWPTPLGAALNSTEVTFDAGGCSDAQVEKTLRSIGEQVVGFALSRG